MQSALNGLLDHSRVMARDRGIEASGCRATLNVVVANFELLAAEQDGKVVVETLSTVETPVISSEKRSITSSPTCGGRRSC